MIEFILLLAVAVLLVISAPSLLYLVIKHVAPIAMLTAGWAVLLFVSSLIPEGSPWSAPTTIALILLGGGTLVWIFDGPHVQKTNKFRAIKTEVDGIVFDSKLEAKKYQEFKLLEKAGQIQDLQLQVRYDLCVNNQKVCTYVADFVFVETEQR